MNTFASNAPVYHPPLEPYLSVIHRDDDVLVLDKPSGLLSVPGRHPALADSLASRLHQRFPQARLVHRLDKDTSGIVLASLTRSAHAGIAAQFEARTVSKSYIAEVWGHVREPEGTIDLPLASDPDAKPRHRVDHERGRPALTRWRVLSRGAGSTRLLLMPVTGRTHQLRVHLKAIGHVILGDEFYADGEALHAASRLLLHAGTLGIRHPDGSDVTYSAPVPF